MYSGKAKVASETRRLSELRYAQFESGTDFSNLSLLET